jgi:hypothetical protein
LVHLNKKHPVFENNTIETIGKVKMTREQRVIEADRRTGEENRQMCLSEINAAYQQTSSSDL